MVPGMSSLGRKTTPRGVGRKRRPHNILLRVFSSRGIMPRRKNGLRSIDLKRLDYGVLILSRRSWNEPEPGETALYIDPVAYRPGDGLCRLCRSVEPGARLCEVRRRRRARRGQ